MTLYKRLVILNINVFEAKNITGKNVHLNASIPYLRVFVLQLALDTRLLSPSVFADLRVLNVANAVAGVQSDLFSHLPAVRAVILQLSNLPQLLWKGLDWVRSLNSNISVSTSTAKTQLVDHQVFLYLYSTLGDDYACPDTDFRLFSRFPHSQLVFPVVFMPDSYPVGNMTCTYLWLVQYVDSYTQLPSRDQRFMPSGIISDFGYLKSRLQGLNLSELLAKCNFELMLSKCVDWRIDEARAAQGSSNAPSDSSYTYQYYQYMIRHEHGQFDDFVLTVILFPIVCFLGLLLNMLSVVTLAQPLFRKDLRKTELFQYMLVNAVFNSLECLIYLFNLLSVCIEPAGIYCKFNLFLEP